MESLSFAVSVHRCECLYAQETKIKANGREKERRNLSWRGNRKGEDEKRQAYLVTKH